MRVGWTVRDLIGLLAQRRRPELFPEVLIKFCLSYENNLMRWRKLCESNLTVTLS
jgi:hypothetical protein